MEYTVHVGIKNHRIADLVEALTLRQFRQSVVIEGDAWEDWGDSMESGLPDVLHAQVVALSLSNALMVATELIETERKIGPEFPRLLRPMENGVDNTGVLIIIAQADLANTHLYSFGIDLRNLPDAFPVEESAVVLH